MRAVRITRPGGPEVLEVCTVDDPAPPGPHEVTVAVSATAVNRADLLQRMGRYPAPPGTRDDIPGLEISGIVQATGALVTDHAVGDRVMALLPGEGYAEAVVLPAGMLMSVPPVVDLVEAAGVPEAFLTAFDALFLQCALSPGEAVLIHAVGSGVGTAAVQLASAAGCTTFGTAGSASKLEAAGALGLHVGIDRTSEDFVRVVAERTGGRGVDVVLDLVGGDYVARSVRALASLGRMALVGTLGGRTTSLDIAEVMRRRIQIRGTVLRSRPAWEKAALTATFSRRVLPWFDDGRVRPVIDSVLPLEEAAAAHRLVEGNATFGKVVLATGSA